MNESIEKAAEAFLAVLEDQYGWVVGTYDGETDSLDDARVFVRIGLRSGVAGVWRAMKRRGYELRGGNATTEDGKREVAEAIEAARKAME